MSRRDAARRHAEAQVVGAVLCDPGCLGLVVDRLEPDDFYDRECRAAWAAMRELFADDDRPGITTSTVAVRAGIAPEALNAISSTVFTSANVEHDARLVREEARRRRLAVEAHELEMRAKAGEDKVAALLDEAQERLHAIAEETATHGLLDIAGTLGEACDWAETAHAAGGELVGLRTPLPDLNRKLLGLRKQNLYVLAARPSMGKTALALNIAADVAKRGDKVALFSIEMSRLELVQRLLATESGIDLRRIMTGQMTPDQWATFTRAAGKVGEWAGNLLIDDADRLTPTALRGSLRRATLRHDVSLVVVDYLQLMTGTRRNDSRVQEISEISRSLKSVARAFDVPTLALSQLSRKVEERDDPTPRLSDLRDGGTIEQDADAVIFVMRPDKDAELPEGQIERAMLRVAKNRNGPVGFVANVGFRREVVQFINLARREDEPA